MNILICDDDAAYAGQCKDQLAVLADKHNAEVDIEITESGNQFMLFADTKYAKVDLIYLDIHMPGVDGMEIAVKLREKNVVADIVFYTVDSTHAIDGYDVEALHYIVKGKTDANKFEEIFLKALRRAERRSVELLSLSCAGEHRNISIKDILYFEVKNRIVTVYYEKATKVEHFEFYSSLSKIEEFLYGKDFIRIHGSYLISKRHIRKKSIQQVEMDNGDVLSVGRTYANNVKD